MAKEKTSSKAAAPVVKKASKPSKTDKVQAGRVSKSAEKTKTAAKEAAKKTAKVVEKKSKKKAPTPPSESEDESDDTSDSSASSDDEEEVKPAKTNGVAKAVNGKGAASSTDDSSSESEEEKAAKPKLNGAAKPAAKPAAKEESDEEDSDGDSEEDSDERSDEKEVPAAKAGKGKVAAVAKKQEAESSDDDSDSASDEEDTPNGKAEADDDDDDSSDSSEDEEEEKPKAQESKKRKADSEPVNTPKKSKTEDVTTSANLFVGNLSWSVDEEWLTREFEEFGEIAGVRIITDRDSGRSKGFGYVEFKDAADAAKALNSKNGSELDGREIRIDYSTPRDGNSNNNSQTPQQRSQQRREQYGDVPNEPSTTLFVGNISFDADESMVREVFEEYGTINGVRLPTDQESGNPKGFGYVEMGSIEEAKAAFEALGGVEIAGRAIRLDYASARPSNAGGRGGGGGGFGGGRGGGRGGRGGFDRGGRGGGRGGRGGFDRGGGRGRGAPRGRGGSTNRGGFGDFSGSKISF